MSGTGALFEIQPEYCIDTNVIVSFLSESDDEYYGADVFSDHWTQIERLILNGQMIAPRQVGRELEGHANKREKIGPWLREHAYMFRDVDIDAQLNLAKRIVNQYPAYGKNMNYLGDLEVITLAGALDLTVVSLESMQLQAGQRRPKIPNVCAEFEVAHTSVVGLFRMLKQTSTTSLY